MFSRSRNTRAAIEERLFYLSLPSAPTASASAQAKVESETAQPVPSQSETPQPENIVHDEAMPFEEWFDEEYDVGEDRAVDQYLMGNCENENVESQINSEIRDVMNLLLPLKLSRQNMSAVFQAAPLITRNNITFEDLKSESDKLYEDLFKPITNRYCSSCFSVLKTQSSVCLNICCSLYKRICRKSTECQQTVITTYSIKEQIKQAMSGNLSELIQTHHQHHLMKRNGWSYDDLRSFRNSEFYGQHIETDQEFHSHRLKVPLTLSFDGFQPKNHSKDELTPIYLRIEGFSDEVLESEFIIVCGILSGPKGLYMDNLTFKDCDGSIWNVTFECATGLIDYKALRAVSSLPNWQSLSGCIFCTLIGTRDGRGAVSYYSEDVYPHRTEGEVTQIMRESQSLNALTVLVNPVKTGVDQLHLLAEGVVKRTLTDLVGVTKYMPGVKLSSSVIKDIDNTLQKMSTFSSARSRLPTFSKLGKLSGSQIHQVSRIVFSLLAIANIYRDTFLRQFFLVFVRFMDGCISVQSTEHLVQLRTMAMFMKRHLGRHPAQYSLKWHVLLDHTIDKIEKQGNLKGTSTSPFERAHKNLSVDYNQHSTNCKDLAKTFLLGRSVKATETQVTDRFEIAPNVLVSGHFVVRDHGQLQNLRRLMPDGLQVRNFWSRILYNKKLLSSNSWKRISNSNACAMRLQTEQGIVFGHPMSYVQTEDDILVLLVQYSCSNPLNTLYYDAMHDNQDFEALDLLWDMSTGNDWIARVHCELEPILVSIDCFLSKCDVVNFRQEKYIIESHI